MADPGPVVFDEDPRLVMHTLGDESAGRVLAVLAGVHGDEPEGPLAASDLLRQLQGAPLRGAVRVVTVANPEAFANSSRCNPADDQNLARVFPGDPAGSPTERLASVAPRSAAWAAPRASTVTIWAFAATAGRIGELEWYLDVLWTVGASTRHRPAGTSTTAVLDYGMESPQWLR